MLVGTVRLVHLAHLSQVDCQFGIRHKPLQNNNLQFGACLFKPTWLTLRTVTGPGHSTRSQHTPTFGKALCNLFARLTLRETRIDLNSLLGNNQTLWAPSLPPPPIAIVVVYQHLIVQPIDFHFHGS